MATVNLEKVDFADLFNTDRCLHASAVSMCPSRYAALSDAFETGHPNSREASRPRRR